ncbi:DUF3224 domain-containing protein [Streptomyces tsukubensis]|uniref:DUF3224 domain-containing protein n=1 Tax=Streptomyces tsukubensis TaxID=83656 RepID=A0A1V4AC81_9ACTN|nr:DUF3224 domain-containing protein [Streptomyces tsukubensis]OON81441.1 hypothetical protein B1H18_09015 [Streptomyces tsukubensis]QFR95430.1 DUF3224 family protein [Streptomyces tsukubensis]
MPKQTDGHFAYADWEEEARGAHDTYPRLAHASVSNSFSGGVEAAKTSCEYVIVYVTETTGTFTGMESLTGTLDGRAGTFVVEERGSFDEEGTVRCAFEVVPGSGTGALTGLRGKGTFTAPRGERSIPYTFAYRLP